MTRKKYIYHYYFNNSEVSKTEFLNHFNLCFLEQKIYCGWCGVDTLNERKRDNALRRLKQPRAGSYIYCGGEGNGSYQIKREELKQ